MCDCHLHWIDLLLTTSRQACLMTCKRYMNTEQSMSTSPLCGPCTAYCSPTCWDIHIVYFGLLSVDFLTGATWYVEETQLIAISTDIKQSKMPVGRPSAVIVCGRPSSCGRGTFSHRSFHRGRFPRALPRLAVSPAFLPCCPVLGNARASFGFLACT